MQLRAATEKDIPVIRQLAYDTWPAAYGEILTDEQLEYMLNLIYSHTALLQQMNNGHHFIIAETTAPVGFASYSPVAGQTGIYKLHKLYVLPGSQKTGTGKTLIQEVIKQVKAAGAQALWLNVNRHNKARHFYEKHGFSVIREEDIDIGNGFFMNDYVMELQLAD